MEIENLLSDLIRIQSINPPGGETEVAKYLKNLFDSYQINNEIIEPSPGRASFIAYLGEGRKSLLYLAHTDVVPVSEGWSFDPFSGEIKDGFVHGRGALDCKGLLAAQAYAAIKLAQNSKLGGRLIFAATAGEETGGTIGVKYLVDNYRDKLKADYLLTEGGWEPLKIGGKTCHFIQVGEKGIIRLKLRTKGTSAHGSLPLLGDNAVVKMAEVISNLAKYKSRIVFIPEVSQIIQTITKFEGITQEINEENIDWFIQQQTDRMLAAYLFSITRNTISPNVVHGGTKTNIIPDSCEAEVDLRFLPGQEKDDVIKGLSPLLNNAEAEVFQYNLPSMSSRNTEFYRLTEELLKEHTGSDGTILPCVSAGATDSRHLRGLGMPCYGLSMMTLNLEPAMAVSIHGRNEKIDIASLKLKSDFLIALAKKYLG